MAEARVETRPIMLTMLNLEDVTDVHMLSSTIKDASNALSVKTSSTHPSTHDCSRCMSAQARKKHRIPESLISAACSVQGSLHHF